MMSAHLRTWRRIGIAFLEMVFPCKCHACGEIFRPHPEETEITAPGEREKRRASFEHAMRTRLCPACLTAFAPAVSPLCSQCGVVFTSMEGADHLCGECMVEPKHFLRARAVGIYSGSLMALIQSLKFKGMTALARPFSALMFEIFQRYWESGGIDLVLPVPLHPKRMRSRGFNQAWLLVRDWPERVRKAYGQDSGIQVRHGVLVRNRPTDPQTGLGKGHRAANLKGAFSVADAQFIAGKRILLVDDVVTTTATVNECARVLLAAGAGQVEVLAVARTL
ncbi:MAG: ComF family protein [Pseudomonadota bacterium]